MYRLLDRKGLTIVNNLKDNRNLKNGSKPTMDKLLNNYYIIATDANIRLYNFILHNI